MPLTAQSPYTLSLNEALPVPASRTLAMSIGSSPWTPYAIFADLDPGPVHLVGEHFYLGFTPWLTAVDAGVTSVQGTVAKTFPVTTLPSMSGQSIFCQAVFLDAQAPNGTLGVSNHQTVVFYAAAPYHHREFFEHPTTRMTGTFDAAVKGRLQGSRVTRRLHSTVDPQGVPLGRGILGPISRVGGKTQMVYRPGDLGSRGQPEWVTGIHWRPLQGHPVKNGVVDRLELFAMHSLVKPDYSVDPWSALPSFPQSGLSSVYASNLKTGQIPQQLFDQPYVIRPQDLRADGYMPYPVLTQPFRYNGQDSLLLEFHTHAWMNPSPQPNAQQVSLMCVTGPLPAACVTIHSSFLNPRTMLVGNRDSTMADYQIEFALAETFAQSAWLKALVPAPDYQPPVLTQWLPPGTKLTVKYRGALDAAGTGATPWNVSVDIADGFPMLQFRALFEADLASDNVPALDAIVIPYR